MQFNDIKAKILEFINSDEYINGTKHNEYVRNYPGLDKVFIELGKQFVNAFADTYESIFTGLSEIELRKFRENLPKDNPELWKQHDARMQRFYNFQLEKICSMLMSGFIIGAEFIQNPEASGNEFVFKCEDCGNFDKTLNADGNRNIICSSCKSRNVKKLYRTIGKDSVEDSPKPDDKFLGAIWEIAHLQKFEAKSICCFCFKSYPVHHEDCPIGLAQKNLKSEPSQAKVALEKIYSFEESLSKKREDCCFCGGIFNKKHASLCVIQISGDALNG